MIRTSILLPPSLKTAAEAAADERGLSLGALIRQQLAAVVSPARRSARSGDCLFAGFAPYLGPAPKDLAERHDDALYGDDA